MPDSTPDCSRTPPHLKWLLNERTMLCGEIDRHQRSFQALQAEMATLHVRVRALDQFSPSLNPAAAGTVHAHAGKYGSFGGLTAFVQEQLQFAGKSGVDTLTLMERAALRFCIELHLPGARKRFKDTITWSLRDLQRNRMVEVAQESRGGRRLKVWRAVGETTLQDLIAEAGATDSHDPHAT